jgi:hypothetical protein
MTDGELESLVSQIYTTSLMLILIGKHGSFLTNSDKYVPGHLVSRKWECCMTLDKYSWGYRRDLKA